MIALNRFIDHTLLHPSALPKNIKALCDEAKKYSFYSVCVHGSYIPLAKKELLKSTIKIAAVVGFPLGAMSSKVKIFEAQQSIFDGADEIDMVLNIGLLKAKQYNLVEEEITAIKKVAGNIVVKVILENCYLTDTEKKIACKLAINGGADFIKTSTGFGTGGATFSDIKLMIKEANNQIKIKASGGINNYEQAKKYIDLGVHRIGSSSGVKIVTTI